MPQEKIMRPLQTRLVFALMLSAAAATVSAQQSNVQHDRSQSPNGIPAGGPYVPAGTLYDNEQSNGITSLASQNSTGTVTARTADDFILTGACGGGVFDISAIRVQMVQTDAAPQPFALDIFADNGSNTAPASGINPIETFAQTSQTGLGAFGVGTTIFEATFATPGLQLNANTRYWLSGYGATAASNAAGFNNFFASSNGATGTTANGVIIAPGSGVADWTPVETVIGPPALAFSFAIDGVCGGGPARAVPASDNRGLMLAGLLLGLVGIFAVRRVMA
jgi:hypothetical protein